MKLERFLLPALVAAGAGVFAYAQFRPRANVSDLNSPNGQAFLEALDLLERQHLTPVNRDKLLEGAISGMLYALNDEFTYYIPPAEATTGREDLQGEFFGIGVGISPANKDGTGVLVETVYRGSPAAQAGLQANDVILSANGKDISKLPLDQAVRLIRGPNGSTVKLVILRNGSKITLTAIRAKITKVNVESTVLPNRIGYVAISDFANQKVTEQLQAQLKSMSGKIKALVLDLRNNPGGLVSQAEGVADTFLEKGDIFITRDNTKQIKVDYSARPQGTDFKLPMVVLVNGSSASASEIVAAALQELGRAKVVGEKTFGKGVANIPTPLSNDGQLNVANKEWLTPKRNSLYKRGVTPDVMVQDSRYANVLALEGIGAKPGSTLELKVNGKLIKLTADKTGKFTYQDTPPRTKNSSVQGEAVVTLENDAQLKKALELLK
ncbi:MAG: S41 family peptidase [Deinococcales bacterium]